MSTKNQKKDKKNILQIIAKLKACPSPQGGLFLFLVVLLILEDLEQQETIDLVSMILINEDSSILDQEWDFYILMLSVLLQKTRRLDSLKLNKLIENSKNIPVYLRGINDENTHNIENLICFLNENTLSIHEKVSNENLGKMRTANLDRLLKTPLKNNKVPKEDMKQTNSKRS